MASAAPVRSVQAHPIHAMLAAFPLALFCGALLTDIAYANTAEMQWANFSVWLITFGLAMGVLAAVAGIVDALRDRGRPRGRERQRRPWWHGVGTALMLAFALVNAFVHSRDAWTSVVPTGLILSAIVALLAIATSWQGFRMQEAGR